MSLKMLTIVHLEISHAYQYLLFLHEMCKFLLPTDELDQFSMTEHEQGSSKPTHNSVTKQPKPSKLITARQHIFAHFIFQDIDYIYSEGLFHLYIIP